MRPEVDGENGHAYVALCWAWRTQYTMDRPEEKPPLDP
jgi:hypothetical protein